MCYVYNNKYVSIYPTPECESFLHVLKEAAVGGGGVNLQILSRTLNVNMPNTETRLLTALLL